MTDELPFRNGLPTVSGLIEELKKLPQDRGVMCQLIGEEEGVWNMCFEFINVESSDWLVQLKVHHPNMLKLPMQGDKSIDNSNCCANPEWVSADNERVKGVAICLNCKTIALAATILLGNTND